MKMRAMTVVLMGVVTFGMRAQVTDPQVGVSTAQQQGAPQGATTPTQQDPAQQKAAQTFAAKKPAAPSMNVPKNAALIPLTPRERVVQLLDRFAFGPMPGDVDRVLTMGADRWVEQQLNPNAINDNGLNKRLAD